MSLQAVSLSQLNSTNLTLNNSTELTNQRFIKRKVSISPTDIFKKFDKVWSYLSKTIFININILNATLKSPNVGSLRPSQINHIRIAVNHLKIFYVINLPLIAKKIVDLTTKMWKGIKDRNEKILTALTISVLVADFFDSMITLVNASRSLMSRATIGWMAEAAMPLAFFMLGMGTIPRVVHLKNLSKFNRDLEQTLLKRIDANQLSKQELKGELTKFLNEKLGPAESRNKSIEWHTNAKTVEKLSALQEMIKTKEALSDDDWTEIVEKLNEVKQIIAKEKTIEKCSMVATAILTAGRVAFFLAVPPIATPILIATGIAARIGVQIYQDWNSRKQVKV